MGESCQGRRSESAMIDDTTPAEVTPVISQRTVRLITFGGGYTLPAWVAERNGFFERHGIRVAITHTPDSVFLMTGLINGEFDIAVTAIDNLVAYQEEQGEVRVDAPVSLAAFMGVDDSFQSLMAAPGVHRVEELRGRKIAVDALTTGYIFIIKEILARAGLSDTDVSYERTGGGPRRLQAMLGGEYAAGLLATPLDAVAAEQGFTCLGTARGVLGHYQGRTGFARRPWIRQNREAVIAFMRGYRDAMDWLYEPSHRNEATGLMCEHDKALTPELARRSLDILLAESGGFTRDLALDFAGIQTVLDLRSRFGRPPKPMQAPSAYVDASLFQEAFPAS